MAQMAQMAQGGGGGGRGGGGGGEEALYRGAEVRRCPCPVCRQARPHVSLFACSVPDI